jgi:hypothetical protein
MNEQATAVTTTEPESKPGTAMAAFDFSPKSLTEAMELAKMMATSTIVPKDYIDKPGNVLVAIQMGAEVGLKPMQAMQNIAVINGRPSLWGDAVLAIVRSATDATGAKILEGIDEVYDESTKTATCTVKRRGSPPVARTFSMADAVKADLSNKPIWKQYPQRMLQMRARSWALRDVFTDVMRGMPIAEEVMDYNPPEKDVTPGAPPAPAASPQDAALELALRRRADQICAMFDRAVTPEDFKAATEAAKRLPDGEHRQKAIDAHHRAKNRLTAATATDAAPSAAPAAEPPISAETVAAMIERSANKDEADLAADSIRAFPEAVQAELWKVYTAKVAEFKPAE